MLSHNKEFAKTAELIAEYPWEMAEGREYIKELLDQNKTKQWRDPFPLEILIGPRRDYPPIKPDQVCEWYGFAPGTPKTVEVRRKICRKSKPPPAYAKMPESKATKVAKRPNKGKVLTAEEKKKWKQLGKGCSKDRWTGTCAKCKATRSLIAATGGPDEDPDVAHCLEEDPDEDGDSDLIGYDTPTDASWDTDRDLFGDTP